MDNKAQGAFEYILLLAGILLVVILVVVILRNSIVNQSNNQIGSNLNTYFALTNCTGPVYNTTTNTSQMICGGTAYNVS